MHGQMSRGLRVNISSISVAFGLFEASLFQHLLRISDLKRKDDVTFDIVFSITYSIGLTPCGIERVAPDLM